MRNACVVAFKTGGIPEIVKQKEKGYLADQGNLDDLIKGIKFFS
jgi:glycosyltransferase involved in cell wall biosynthesis